MTELEASIVRALIQDTQRGKIEWKRAASPGEYELYETSLPYLGWSLPIGLSVRDAADDSEFDAVLQCWDTDIVRETGRNGLLGGLYSAIRAAPPRDERLRRELVDVLACRLGVAE